MKILAVVVSYYSGTHLPVCVESILVDMCATVVIVNNSGDAGTQQVSSLLSERFGNRVRYLDPKENLGYGRACNMASEVESDYDYVAIVNPDVQLSRPLSSIVQESGEAPVAILSGILRPGSGSSQLNARPECRLYRELLKAAVGTRAYRLRIVAAEDEDSVRVVSVAQVDGALMILRRDSWRSLGGFDDRFELYYEDVDICRRAAALNGVGLLNRVVGSHVGGSSFEYSRGRAYALLRVSRVRYLRKWSKTRIGGVVGPVAVVLVETIARGLSRQKEGTRARITALRLSICEAIFPSTVSLLER